MDFFIGKIDNLCNVMKKSEMVKEKEFLGSWSCKLSNTFPYFVNFLKLI